MPHEVVEDAETFIDLKDSIAFWQKEVHYYEGRAAEQGASANRLVTVAGGAVAALGIVSAVATAPEKNLYLLLVPVVILLMWATAIRLLHEMSILRVYREHAEKRLGDATLKDKSGDLAAYRSWKDPGSKFDMPPVITVTWFFFAAGLSIAGTVGVFLLIGAQLKPWMGLVAWSIFVVAVLALSWTFLTNVVDSDQVATRLGMTPVVTRGTLFAWKIYGAFVRNAKPPAEITQDSSPNSLA